ncbi:porin family protein [Teredinibacter franksiae]|uniref:porin family protein n=1 Tax=Teredinibacter franksiae TaxID=2761453 RepID=UPI0016251683|nr:porin family protein [Teredinibacter franksiae]
MKNLKTLLCVLAIAPLSSMVQAGSDSGIYVGGSLGTAKQSMTFELVKGEIDESDMGYKFFAGYNFGLFPLVDLAVEASYIDFGSVSSNVINQEFDVETSAWNVYGVAGINLGLVGLFGKVGTVAWESDVTFDTLDQDRALDGTDMAYGIGAKIQLDSFAVRAEYEYFDFEDIDTNMFSVGASITF